MINRTLLVLVFVAIFACKSDNESEVKSINSFDDPILMVFKGLPKGLVEPRACLPYSLGGDSFGIAVDLVAVTFDQDNPTFLGA